MVARLLAAAKSFFEGLPGREKSTRERVGDSGLTLVRKASGNGRQ